MKLFLTKIHLRRIAKCLHKIIFITAQSFSQLSNRVQALVVKVVNFCHAEQMGCFIQGRMRTR